MALTLSTAIRNAMVDAATNFLDSGVTDANGDFVLMTALDVEVATLPLSNPAFAGSVNGVANANAIASDTSATGGIAALFKMQNRDNAEGFRGTVTGTGGGGDVEATNPNIAANDTVQVTGTPTFTQPAS